MTVPYTFGNESSPIPLSQLDANFATIPGYANTAGNVANAAQPNITSVGTLTSLSVSGSVTSGNLITGGTIDATGNIAAGNIATGGNISAFGTVSGSTITTVGTVSATGNITGNNFISSNQISAIGNIIGGNITTAGKISAQGNILAQGIISATGNIVTAGLFIGNFQGNITGNLSVGGANTQVLFNNNGNVGAAGGLTYNSGSNTLSVLGVVSAQGNIIGGNVLIGSNLLVSGTSQFVGLATAPTAPTGTANNQVATTAFVSTTVGTLGTMASQNAISVAITGGTIGNGILTLASISNSNISNSNISNAVITNSTLDGVRITGGWSVIASGATLYFQYNGNSIAKLDSSGNFTTIGDVAAFGTV
jgi:hypothetical protein